LEKINKELKPFLKSIGCKPARIIIKNEELRITFLFPPQLEKPAANQLLIILHHGVLIFSIIGNGLLLIYSLFNHPGQFLKAYLIIYLKSFIILVIIIIILENIYVNKDLNHLMIEF
jgi:hypothetical protein